MAVVARVQVPPAPRLTLPLATSRPLRPPNQSYQVAKRVNHIVWLALLEFFQSPKAIRDGTGLEAGGFPSQDVRGGIANHEGLLWGTVQRGKRGDDGIWGRL